jgi:hypothetical protein
MNVYFQNLTKTLDKSKKTLRAARTHIQKTLRDLYLDRIYPNRTFRDPDDGVEFLIAFKGSDDGLAFWKTEETSVLDVNNGCESIGSGGPAADFFSAYVYQSNMKPTEALAVAVDILRQTKRFSPFCSGPSEIRVIDSNGRITMPLVEPLKQMEDYLQGCEQKTRELMIRCADANLSERDIDQHLQSFSQHIKNLTAQLKFPLQKTLLEWFGSTVSGRTSVSS